MSLFVDAASSFTAAFCYLFSANDYYYLDFLVNSTIYLLSLALAFFYFVAYMFRNVLENVIDIVNFLEGIASLLFILDNGANC